METITIAAKRCKECNGLFPPLRTDQIFCHTRCKDKWYRRARLRGGQIYELVMTWRKTRGKERSISDISAVVDGWIAEDREREKKQRSE